MILHGQRRTLAETDAPTVHEVQEVVARDQGRAVPQARVGHAFHVGRRQLQYNPNITPI